MMKHIEKMNEIYGPPLSLQDLCDNVFYYANQHYFVKRKLLGWGMKVHFDKKVTNTHYAPHNGTSNWEYVDYLPRGYPGWYGRVWIIYDKQGRMGSSQDDNLFPNLRLYTGSGGYGLYSCPFYSYKPVGHKVYPVSYDFRFFQADWPSLILGHAFGAENKTSRVVYKMKGGLIEKTK